MKKTLVMLFVNCCLFAQTEKVGIGTANPQKELHIEGSNSTIRIEKLNSVNSSTYNKGGSSLTPVFVDKDGELTLSPPGFDGSNSGDLAPLNFLITLNDSTTPAFIPDGVIGVGTIINNLSTETVKSGQIISIPFNAPQSSMIEVKYGITAVLSDEDLSLPLPPMKDWFFNDESARSIQIYFCIDLDSNGLDATELGKKYGFVGQSYGSTIQGILGTPYMNGAGYSEIPAGNHSLVFFGLVMDGSSKFTSVGFGTAQDYLKIRIFN